MRPNTPEHLSKRRLRVETLESRRVFASLPMGATNWDTAEYMLGRIAVTPVFLESNGSIDTDTESWTNQQKMDVRQSIVDGLNFWVDLLATKTSVHQLEWVLDDTWINNPASTAYEPISRPSNDYTKWVPEFLTNQGYAAGNGIEANIRAFNDAQRQKLDTDWSFTIFVVNSQNDPNGSFAPGTFSRAFTFAGGLFEVVPSTRPASTFAHETGHIFYARDEYAGGSDYFQKRGYYDTQNTNAIDQNPTPNFQQADSIMSSGAVLDRAYQNHVSPDATLAQIGWQDSDNDGIFDVLDVPLGLTGVGSFDTSTQSFKFSGRAFAQALPNKNSSGLGNSITLNKVTDIQYRFSGDTQWQTTLQPNQYTADLDLTIPIQQANLGRTIEIRAIDSRIGVVSDSFVAPVTGSPKITNQVGMSGLVWNDSDGDGVMDSGESGRSGWNVQILSSAGAALNLYSQVTIGTLPDGVIAANQFAGVSLRDTGTDATTTNSLGIGTSTRFNSKALVPFSLLSNRLLEGWNSSHVLELTFDNDISTFSMDAAAVSALTRVRVRYYDDNGTLLDSKAYEITPASGIQKLTVHDSQSRIHKVVIEPLLNTVVDLGKFEFGIPTTAVSDASGIYRLDAVPNGNYQVSLAPPRNIYNLTIASNGIINVGYSAGDQRADLNLGAQLPLTAWFNVAKPLDINNDGNYTSLDLLQIINTINFYGRGSLEASNVPVTSLVDANGDRFLSSLDALAVINNINALQRSGGEGESNFASVLPQSANALNPQSHASASTAIPSITGKGEDTSDDQTNVSTPTTVQTASQQSSQPGTSLVSNVTAQSILSPTDGIVLVDNKQTRIQSVDESLSLLNSLGEFG